MSCLLRLLFMSRGSALLVLAAITCGCSDSSTSDSQPADASPSSSDDTVRERSPLTPTAIAFREVSQQLGLTCRQRNGEESLQRTVLEFLGSGVSVIDIDIDGRPDLVFAGGGTITAESSIQGTPSSVYRQAAGEFVFTDVTVSSRVDTAELYSHAVVAADFNNDGFTDLLVTGWSGLQHWMNCGDGTFAAEPVATAADRTWCSSAAAGDFNGDGVLDLYVTRYTDWSFQNHPECLTRQQERDICNPGIFRPAADDILLSTSSSFAATQDPRYQPRADGRGLSALVADLDGDSFPDIYVANDMTANFLYRNTAGEGLREEGLLTGTALDPQAAADGSMGLAMADYNADGLPDLWVTNYEHEQFALYQNLGGGAFHHVSESVGLAQAVGDRVGWGTSFQDFDCDGDPDLFATVGHPHYDADLPREQLPVLAENLGGRFFRDVRPLMSDAWFSQPQNARGVCAADLNRDGRTDLVICNLNGTPSVLLNQTPGTQTLRLRLIGTTACRDAIGATVTLETSKQRSIRRWVTGGGSYLSTSDPWLSFALQADELPERLRIRWPGGGEELQMFNAAAGAFCLVQNPMNGGRTALVPAE